MCFVTVKTGLNVSSLQVAGSKLDATQQIVGPERRLRFLHHHWSGEA
jgi:hypothetical protein